MSTADNDALSILTEGVGNHGSKDSDDFKSVNDSTITNFTPSPSTPRTSRSNQFEFPTPLKSNVGNNTSRGAGHSATNPHLKKEEELRKEKKVDEILSCLNGALGYGDGSKDDDRMVDLWKLRQLALSRDGLMNPTIRKRAWPKLIGVDEHILTTSASAPSAIAMGSHQNSYGTDSEDVSLNDDESSVGSVNTIELTDDDMTAIKKDVVRCVWDVEETMKGHRRERERKDDSSRRERDDNTRETTHTRVRIHHQNDDDLSTIASVGSWETCHTGSASRVSTLLIPNDSRAFTTESGIVSPYASGTSTPVSESASKYSKVTLGSSSTNNSKRRKSRREIGLLMNIVTTVMRTAPEGETDQRLYYYMGMNDVVALLLINLESPSLTSLMMKRLATCHFRDAMRSDFEVLEVSIKTIIMPLLEAVDKNLHDYIFLCSTGYSSAFALPWVITWFSHVIRDFDVASRLFDVFLVSHPLFPVYFSVALLTLPTNREFIMKTSLDYSSLLNVLCNLPKTMMGRLNDSNRMDTFENLIKVAISYIREFPPNDLLSDAHTYRNGHLQHALKSVPSELLAKELPRWSIAPTAPTDWSLIQLAKEMRSMPLALRLAKHRSLRLKHFIQDTEFLKRADELPLAASGLTDIIALKIALRTKRRSRIRRIVFCVAIVVSSIIIYVSWSSLSLQKPVSPIESQVNQNNVKHKSEQRTDNGWKRRMDDTRTKLQEKKVELPEQKKPKPLKPQSAPKEKTIDPQPAIFSMYGLILSESEVNENPVYTKNQIKSKKVNEVKAKVEEKIVPNEIPNENEFSKLGFIEYVMEREQNPKEEEKKMKDPPVQAKQHYLRERKPEKQAQDTVKKKRFGVIKKVRLAVIGILHNDALSDVVNASF